MSLQLLSHRESVEDATRSADMLSLGWVDTLIIVVCAVGTYWWFFLRQKDDSSSDANAIKSLSIQ